ATTLRAVVPPSFVLSTFTRSVRVSGCFNHVSNRSPRRGVRVGTDVPFDWVHGAPHQTELVSSPPYYWTTPLRSVRSVSAQHIDVHVIEVTQDCIVWVGNLIVVPLSTKTVSAPAQIVKDDVLDV